MRPILTMMTPDAINNLFYRQDSTWGKYAQRVLNYPGRKKEANKLRKFLDREWSKYFAKWVDAYPKMQAQPHLWHDGWNEILSGFHDMIYPEAREAGFPDATFLFPDIDLERSTTVGAWYDDNDLLAATLGVAAIANPGVGLALGVAQKANNVVAAAKAGDATAKKKIAAVNTLAKAGDPAAQETVKTMKVISKMQDAKTEGEVPTFYDSGLGKVRKRRRPFAVLRIGHEPFNIVGAAPPLGGGSSRGPSGGVKVTDMGPRGPRSRATYEPPKGKSISWTTPDGALVRAYQSSAFKDLPSHRAFENLKQGWNQTVAQSLAQAPVLANMPSDRWKVMNPGGGEGGGVPIDPNTGLPPEAPPPPVDPYGGYPPPPYGGGGYPPPYGDPFGGPYGGGPGFDPYGGFPPYADPMADYYAQNPMYGDPYGAGLPYDPYGEYGAYPGGVDPYGNPVCTNKQVYDPATDSFYSGQVNQVYDPDTNTFAPAPNYNPYNPYMAPTGGQYGGGDDPLPFDPRVAGWAANIPYRTTAQHLAQVEKSPGIAVAAREMYNQGLGHPKTTKGSIASEALSQYPAAQRLYNQVRKYF